MDRDMLDTYIARADLRANRIAVDAQYATVDPGFCAESRAPDAAFAQHEAHAGQFKAISGIYRSGFPKCPSGDDWCKDLEDHG